MYCSNCGAEIADGVNFCSYCGATQNGISTSVSLLNKAVSVANSADRYNLVLVSCGSRDKTTTGDLLEDVFGYTDAESSKLVSMVPVVVGQNLTANEAQTVAQFLTEYGVQVSITDDDDQYVDLTKNANRSVFDSSGNLLTGVAAVIGALTVANRITSYKRYRKPSLLERLFHISYQPAPPVYHRNFRPHLSPKPLEPRRTIRKPAPAPSPRRQRNDPPHGGGRGGRGGRR